MANSALVYVNAYVINYNIKYSSFLAKKQSFFTCRCFAIEYSKNTFQSPSFQAFLLQNALNYTDLPIRYSTTAFQYMTPMLHKSDDF